MKTKEKTQLQNMGATELAKLVSETEKKLAQFMVNRYSKQSKNPRESRAFRLKIAVAKTLLRQKELQHGQK